jgi:hypothetical protein
MFFLNVNILNNFRKIKKSFTQRKHKLQKKKSILFYETLLRESCRFSFSSCHHGWLDKERVHMKLF